MNQLKLFTIKSFTNANWAGCPSANYQEIHDRVMCMSVFLSKLSYLLEFQK